MQMQGEKKTVSGLTAISDEIAPGLSVSDKALFFAYFYALVLLKPKADRLELFVADDYRPQADYLSRIFPAMARLFHSTLPATPDSLIQKMYRCVQDAGMTAEGVDNTVAWIYQSLKRSLEKKAFGNIGRDNYKLTGRDLLYTTQFFTDEYMVKYLVDECIRDNAGRIEEMVFVDPALGGGNFLSYAFTALFDHYMSEGRLTAAEAVARIVSRQIAGYDLDPALASIATLSLCINIVSRAGMVEIPEIRYFGGVSGDTAGFMAEAISSDKKAGLTFGRYLDELFRSKSIVEFVTNPPFMGRRDMDPSLKELLVRMYPDSNGDLCFSFMEKMMRMLRPGDTLSVVSQNGWLNLSSFKRFRETMLDGYHIDGCTDLGSNAFEAIGGEKTNIVLSRIKKGPSEKKSLFYNLKHLSYPEKRAILTDHSRLGDYAYRVSQQDFRANSACEFAYELAESFPSLNGLSSYSEFAIPMQGTSTGDNAKFVRYIWEPETSGPEWKPVSKGGGYSKWQGLNIYKVKWGENGEPIMQNPGSVMRNVREIPFTDLVYSDTGTLGLHVRVLLEGQLFMASGPGIRVIRGDKYCHMAFLNSKIATCLLKIRNPKFTVSAGYIGRLPVSEEMLTSKTISRNARKILSAKREFLTHKLPNAEFRHDDYAAITDLEAYLDSIIAADIELYRVMAVTEARINAKIMEMYGFDEAQKEAIAAMTGLVPTGRIMESVETLDNFFSTAVNECCMPVSRKLNGSIAGSDNLLEMMAYRFGASVTSISNMLKGNLRALALTRERYRLDLAHKLLLKVCDTGVADARAERLLRERYGYLSATLGIDRAMMEFIVNKIHAKVFRNRPVLTLG